MQPPAAHTRAKTGERTPVFRLLQPLRAFAALAVVAHHVTILLGERNHLPVAVWRQGAAGVDIFFVISGFVMALTTASTSHGPRAAGQFLLRRLQRIVPLYWLLTAVKLLLLRSTGMGLTPYPSALQILASFFFIPVRNSVGNFHPVLVVGWTLNFEMAFYALFAFALFLRVRAEFLLAPVLIFFAVSAIHGASLLHGWLDGYGNSIVLEFLYGVWLARATPALSRTPVWLAWALVSGGLALLFISGAPDESAWRGVLWGLPAAATVCGMLALERRFGQRLPSWPVELGDASYSIYLTHGFVLPALSLGLALTHHESLAAVPLVIVLGLFLSAAAGEATYRLIERPLILWFRGSRRSALPVR